MSHTLTVRLDAHLAARLEDAAARANQPVSTLVRQVVTEWLDEAGPRRATTLLAARGSVAGRGISATNANVRTSFRKGQR
jgi:predicted transcriptional regulator